MKRYKLTDAAKMLGINPWTLRRWVYAGKAPNIKSESGRVYIPEWWIAEQTGAAQPSKDVRCALYVREFSSENKSAMASQKEGLIQYATARGYRIIHIICEFGSGVSDDRKKLHALLKKRDFDVLLVEHQDRLTRFGFKWFNDLSPFRIEVVNAAENRVNDLMEDLIAILNAFAARLYGQRRGQKKTEAAIKALQESDP
jgi:Predicted site-specific integrase-resolvase